MKIRKTTQFKFLDVWSYSLCFYFLQLSTIISTQNIKRKMEKQEKNRNRLVLVLYPFQGHINPMLQLATIFHTKGYSITIIHPEFNSPNPSNHPQFTFVSIPDKLLESRVSLAPRDFMNLVSALNKNCAAPFEICLKQMLDDENQRRDRIAGVIYDGLMYFAQTVADEVGLPGFSMRPTAAAMLLFGVIPQAEQESVFESQLPELQPLQLKQMLTSMSSNPSDAMIEVRAGALNATKRSSGMIANTLEFLEPSALLKIRQYSPVPVFTIGPFHKLAPSSGSGSLLQEDARCISWLDGQEPKSVIYVSFGSMASLSEQDIVEIAWGLANSEQPFLWVIRPGLVHGSERTELLLPDGFLEKVGGRGCIVKWAPQKDILAHGAVGGFWTHCGWNSTLESVSEGVPMLCRPCFGDQFLNMRYICEVWKIGLELENELERGKIEGAIRTLMVDIEGEGIRNKAMEFKGKTEVCVTEGGSSSSSLDEFTKILLV